MLRRILFCLFIIFFASESIGQTEDTLSSPKEFYHSQFELRHDNDFLIFTDRYYTTGSFIEYRYLPEQDFSEGRKEHILLGLEQYFYTPSDLIAEDTANFDRPYAGYIGIKAGTLISYPSYAISFIATLGFTGPISLAEAVQTASHSAGPSRIPPWESQIKNNVHINLYGGFTKEWKLGAKPFAVYAALEPKIAFGTQNLYFDQAFKFYFGKRNSLQRSMAYHQLGETDKEFFFSINFAYRYVFHNALIEGYPIIEKSEFTMDATNELFLYGIEGYYRMKRNDFKLGYQYVSKETPKSDWHIYFVISIARRF